MNPLPGRCPVCTNALTVTRLQCGHCGTGIDGQFSLGRLQELTPEQIQFVDTFIKCRGKIKDVEAELGISYPTVVARLNDVVKTMGYEVDDKDLSEVDRYEVYEAQVLHPAVTGQRVVSPHLPHMPPPAPMPPAPPTPHRPRLSNEKRQQIMDDLAAGTITAAEAMKRLQGE
jgi:hypothetical protein